MELGFAVSNLAPLNQITLSLTSADTVIYLAYCALGWWKSRERSLTFEQTLQSVGGTLTSSQSFSARQYLDYRQAKGGLFGIQSGGTGNLVRSKIPVLPTDIDGKHGILCFRALVLALSCLLTTDQVCEVLKIVLPSHLMHFDLEFDDNFKLGGASLAALKQLVTVLINEEHVDVLQRQLYDQLDRDVNDISGVSYLQLQTHHHADLYHIIGVLSWILTAAPYRTNSTYQTKSLKVWALASILSHLGFEVEASRVPLTESSTRHSEQNPTKGLPRAIGEVVLVLSSGWDTDPGALGLPLVVNSPLQSLPRVITMRAVPAFAYAELVRCGQNFDRSVLETVYLETFHHVRKVLPTLSYFCRASGHKLQSLDIELEISYSDDVDFRLRNCLGRYLSVPDSLWGGTKEMVKLIMPMLRKFLGSHASDKLDDEQKVILRHITAAAALAFVSFFIRQDQMSTSSGLDLEFVCDVSDFVEVTPHRGFNGFKQLEYESIFARAALNLNIMADIFGTDLSVLSQPFAPNTMEVLHDRRKMAHSFLRDSWASLVCKIFAGASCDESRPSFGGQGHGLALISDFILKPSVQDASPFLYHLKHGQILDIALKDGIIVSGSQTSQILQRAALDNTCQLGDHNRPNPRLDHLRWDAEPCWEFDPQESCLSIRIDGLEKIQLDFLKILEAIQSNYSNRLTCSLDHATSTGYDGTVLWGSSRRLELGLWYDLPLFSMLEKSQLAVSKIDSADALKRPNWMINTHGSDILAILALQCSFVPSLEPQHRITSPCLECGLDKAVKCGYPSTSVMIIIHPTM